MASLFFRNDDPDVFFYGDKRDILYRMTDVFVGKNIPIAQAVVPGCVSEKTVRYFNRIRQNTGQLELIQHGWKHKKYKMGEFDNTRTYEQQQQDIEHGNNVMTDYFDLINFHAFTAPYGVYSTDTLSILSRMKYQVLSSGVAFSRKRRYFDRLGKLLKRNFIFNKRVSYHEHRCARHEFSEISTSINIIKRMKPIEILSKSEILARIDQIKCFTNYIGILLHHIFLSKKDCVMLGALLDEIKERNISILQISEIHRGIYSEPK